MNNAIQQNTASFPTLNQACKESANFKNESVVAANMSLPPGLPLRVSRVQRQNDLRISMTNPNSHRKVPISNSYRPNALAGKQQHELLLISPRPCERISTKIPQTAVMSDQFLKQNLSNDSPNFSNNLNPRRIQVQTNNHLKIDSKQAQFGSSEILKSKRRIIISQDISDPEKHQRS